jgi:hypothetical protein
MIASSVFVPPLQVQPRRATEPGLGELRFCAFHPRPKLGAAYLEALLA